MTDKPISTLPQTPLEPCPFCGSRCVTLLNGGPGNYFVRCDDCSASSNDVQKDHAVQLWNTRSEQPTPLSPDIAAAINQLIDYADDLDATERPAIGDYDVTADIRSVCEFIRARAVQPDVREALKAAIRAAKLALFVIHKQDVMPNSSWESGFNSDISKAEAALAAPPARSSDETASEASAPPWMPIETAPKDGTEILLGWFDPMQGHSKDVCTWNIISDRWFNGQGPLSRHHAYQPTHWIPLPEPPAPSRPSSSDATRDVTEQDRQYASELLANLASPDLPRLEIAARWFRKARVENSLGRSRTPSSVETEGGK